MDLVQFVYTSTAVREMTGEDLDAIRRVSLARNAGLNVTGLLVYYAQTQEFIQLLEGARSVVLNLYNGSIVKDSRHRAISTLFMEHAEERICPDWRMSFCINEFPELSGREGLSDFVDGGPLDGPDSQLCHRLMIAYRDEIARDHS